MNGAASTIHDNTPRRAPGSIPDRSPRRQLPAFEANSGVRAIEALLPELMPISADVISTDPDVMD